MCFLKSHSVEIQSVGQLMMFLITLHFENKAFFYSWYKNMKLLMREEGSSLSQSVLFCIHPKGM